MYDQGPKNEAKNLNAGLGSENYYMVVLDGSWVLRCKVMGMFRHYWRQFHEC